MNKTEKAKALKVLALAKEIEKARIEKGYKYVTISKLPFTEVLRKV